MFRNFWKELDLLPAWMHQKNWGLNQIRLDKPKLQADDLEFCSINLKAQDWALISAVNFVELGLDLGLKGKAQALKNQAPFSFSFNKRGDKRTIIVGWLNHASTIFLYQSQLSWKKIAFNFLYDIQNPRKVVYGENERCSIISLTGSR